MIMLMAKMCLAHHGKLDAASKRKIQKMEREREPNKLIEKAQNKNKKKEKENTIAKKKTRKKNWEKKLNRNKSNGRESKM